MDSKDTWEDKDDSWENQDVNDLTENLQQLSVDTKKTNNTKSPPSSTYTPKSVKGRGELKYRRYEKERAEEENETNQNIPEKSKPKSSDQTHALRTIPHIDRILEIYDFPSNYTVADLEKILLGYNSFGYRIELVDSTHALVSFNSSSIARDALRNVKIGAKLRSILEASSQSQQIIIKQKGMTSPARQAMYDQEIAEWEGNGSIGRPATSDRVARRLIASALQMPELRSPKSSSEQPTKSRQKTEKKDYWDD